MWIRILGSVFVLAVLVTLVSGRTVASMDETKSPDKVGALSHVMCGDQNLDGAVDIADVIIDLQIAVGAIQHTQAQLRFSDLNGDHAINIYDAIKVLQHIAGLTTIEGCGSSVPWIHGINFPWDNYGTDFGMNAWGYRGLASQGPSGWRRETRGNNDGAKQLFWAEQNDCTEDDPNLGVEVQLDGPLSNAIVFFQFDEPPDKKTGEFLDLRTQTVTAEVCFPPLSGGPGHAPNGVVFFVQWGEDWKWAQSPWMNIRAGQLTLTMKPDDLKTDGLPIDAAQIRTIGIKMGTNSAAAPSYSFTGNIYIDDVIATTASEIQFSFSSPDTRTEQEMKEIAAWKVKALRWWVFVDGRAGLDFNEDGSVRGLADEFISDFDELIRLARSSGLDLVPVLFDFLLGAELKIVDGVQVYGRSELINDETKRKSLLDNAISHVFDMYCEQIVIWDLMNEPEWLLKDSAQFEIPDGMRPSEIAAGGVIDLETMKKFFSEIIDLYEENEKCRGHQRFTVGSASPRWVTLWQDLDLDVIQFHLWNGPGQIDDGLEFDFEPPVNGIPNILGEFSTKPEMQLHSVCEYLEKAYALGYSGAWPWAYRAKDDASVSRLGREGRKCMFSFANDHPVDLGF